MSLTFIQGVDIFGLEGVAIIPVNTAGAMGAGLALAFAKRHPNLEAEYKAACQDGRIAIGRSLFLEENHAQFVAFPTKEHWRNPSKLSYIIAGLATLPTLLVSSGVPDGKVIVFPKLGCGLGGLDWNIVRPLMVDNMKTLSAKYNVIVIE